MVEICPLKFALSELFAQASDRGQLTLADRYGLLANLLNEHSLTDDERHAIDRILRAAARGRVIMADELSALVDQIDS
ncbi:hypothetical protein [Leptolyngbya sp. PCC 6406]|uniref:hypothetical protein n=1 Tax=Leptolyngbya sp. PCC 6406 TaxID=1173264 RepID=UPI0002AC28E3|nr:hypothetical protein [Leptolyngbya sp. PCC 6406]